MTIPVLTPYQREIVDKIHSLQNLTRTMGMRTTRAQNDLLSALNSEDLAQVTLVLYPVPQYR